MSWREHWKSVKSSVVNGDVISGCRDNDTKTYRLFVNKGQTEVRGIGTKFDSCECCDLSIDDMKALISMLQKVVDEHIEWPNFEDNE